MNLYSLHETLNPFYPFLFQIFKYFTVYFQSDRVHRQSETILSSVYSNLRSIK